MAASKTKKSPRSPHPVDVYAGQRLRTRRLLLRMSQNELGEKAGGITFQQIQKYEAGANRMSASRIYELARVLEVPITYFFDGFIEDKKSELAGEDGGDLMNRRETIKLVRAYYAIDDPGLRKRVLSMTRALAKSA